MQTIKWLGFCVAQTMSRSVLHFFPSSDNASAPYAASCTLTLFGPGGMRSSVVLEGGRLGHPDGLRLEDAFPALKGEVSGVFGLEVEISTPQPRLDVTSSGCVVEIVSQGLPVRFAPKKLMRAEVSETIRQLRARTLGRSEAEKTASPEQASEANSTSSASGSSLPRRAPTTGLAIRDGQQVPSLMIVNGSSEPCSASVYSVSAGLPKPSTHVPLTRVELAPGASQELQLDEGFFRAGALEDLSFGRCSALPLVVEVHRKNSETKGSATSSGQHSGDSRGESIPEVASFMVYREALTRRMSSVTSLG
jgi:hypothetical protein